eukprot:scaffold345_cov134-Cylindrotheca_fusiformis.AAC.11
MACIMKPNGNMDYATCMEEARYLEQMEVQKWRKKPRSMPFVSPRTKEHPKWYVSCFQHALLQSTIVNIYSTVQQSQPNDCV